MRTPPKGGFVPTTRACLCSAARSIGVCESVDSMCLGRSWDCCASSAALGRITPALRRATPAFERAHTPITDWRLRRFFLRNADLAAADERSAAAEEGVVRQAEAPACLHRRAGGEHEAIERV